LVTYKRETTTMSGETWMALHRELVEQEKGAKEAFEEATRRREKLEELMGAADTGMVVREGKLPPGTKLPSLSMAAQHILKGVGKPSSIKVISEGMWERMGFAEKGEDRRDFENNLRSAINYSIRKKQGIFTRPDVGIVGLHDWKREPVNAMKKRDWGK
jgi:hypothetical protein